LSAIARTLGMIREAAMEVLEEKEEFLEVNVHQLESVLT